LPTGRLRPGWRLAAFVLALCAGAGALTALWIGLGLPPQRQQGIVRAMPQLASGVLVLGLALAVTRVALRRLEARDLATIGLDRDGAIRGWTLGLLLGGLTPLAVFGVLALAGHAEIRPETTTAGGILRTTLPMVLAVLLLSAWEEIALRGYPLQLLAESWGPSAAAVVTGVVFGLLHAGNPGANPSGLAIIALNGALLALVVIRTGSLWLPCGYHGGWNLMAALVLGLRDSGAVHEGSLLRTALAGPAWLIGGEFGFEASPVTAGVELLVLGWMLGSAARLPGNEVARAFYRGGGERVDGHEARGAYS
jgi:membrane protease YdiL (CAAX protease family)